MYKDKIIGLVVILTLSLFAAAYLRAQARKTISISNRLLLNRVQIEGLERTEIMTLSDPSKMPVVIHLINSFGGKVERSDRVVGYLRAKVPTRALWRLIGDPRIDAYAITSFSNGSWHRDGPTRWIANLMRATNFRPAVRPIQPDPAPSLPILDPATARQPGYTADDGVGIDEWISEHPTFDGRGVTIAMVEGALPEFAHPIFGPAKTLDGRPVDKLAGIINATDDGDYDETRVRLTREINAETQTWFSFGTRTYIMPRAGKYFFGVLPVNVGDSIVQEFGVIQDQQTKEIWIDTDGDTDFSNESPVPDLRRRFEPRFLKIVHPYTARLAFIVTADQPRVVHIYTAANVHQSMTISVGVGAENPDSLAYGVAPGARVLLVRTNGNLSNFIEGYLSAAARPDVDIIDDTFASNLLPGTADDFLGLLFSRIVKNYHKPIFQGAGNSGRNFASAMARGDAFTVGGSLSPKTFEALFGGAELTETVVHPDSSGGPGLDGRLKPDFLAPEERISATTCNNGGPLVRIPKNVPRIMLPQCYMVSGGASSATPFAAGFTALLISAARQTGIGYSVPDLRRALHAGSNFLPSFQAYQQGTGVLNIASAWRELQRQLPDLQIMVKGDNAHALTPYQRNGTSGRGLYEADWTVGERGVRKLIVRRGLGPTARLHCRLTWTNNDGTFESAKAIDVPLNVDVDLPIIIKPMSIGGHSAILNIHDAATDAIIYRSLITVIAPERLSAPSYAASISGSIPLMRSSDCFWAIPPGTAAMELEMTVSRGAVTTALMPSNGMGSGTYDNKTPYSIGRTLVPGTYHLLLSNPSLGTWALNISNTSAMNGLNQGLALADEAQFTLKISAFSASISSTAVDGRSRVAISNKGALLAEPQLVASWGQVAFHKMNLGPNGPGSLIDLTVPPGSKALDLSGHLMQVDRSSELRGVDLYLYDCTSGQCFSYDFAVASGTTPAITVSDPVAGRWVVIASPVDPLTKPASFILTSRISIGEPVERITLDKALAPDQERVIERLDLPEARSDGSVLIYELFDEALESARAQHSWIRNDDLKVQSNRPAQLADFWLGHHN
jgi:hypothetical protein